MPEHSELILGKITDLQALSGGERKPSEVVAIYWPSPAGTKIYASAMYTELPWWPDLAAAIETEFGATIPITLTLIPDGSYFRDLPRTASVSDDSINLSFSDIDDQFSDLLMAHGEGIRTEIFGYWPAVDLFLSMWRGSLYAPKEMSRSQVKVSAVAGWRSPQMLVPRRPHAISCPFIFGALYTTQAEIDQAKGCPYNAHLTELERGGAPLIGVPGFTDCPRRVKADCSERLTEPDTATPTENFWPGFETRPDPIPNNQTSGPNLLARAYGNESNLNDPIRVVFGERYVKSLNLLAFRNETDTNHPEDGFGAALFEISEGPVLALWEFRINGQLVGAEHLQLKLGELGQSPSDWSPDVNSYSGTAHGYGRIQGEFDNATASDYSGSIRELGLVDVRIYSDADTYTEGYTTNRMWCLLHILAHLRWGYGQDYPRYDIESAIDVAAWCDETISITDPNGNVFAGVRSTFNAEVTARAIQQQVKDLCTAGRIGLPFEFNGKDVFVPLKVEDVDDATIPAFTDEGSNRNIVYDGVNSSLSWSYISDDTLTNQWTVNFDDASNGGVDTQLIFGDQPQQLRAGRAWGDRSKRVVNKSQSAFGITNLDEASRLGLSLLYLGPLDSGGILNPWSVKFTTWYASALLVQNYKLIRVQNAKLQSRISAYFTSRNLEPFPGADYTYFRVMKYTRKGDLRVEIEAQLYATIEGEFEPCNPGAAYDIEWTAIENFTLGEDNSLEKTGGIHLQLDATALGSRSYDPNRCTYFSWQNVVDGADPDFPNKNRWQVWIEDENGDNQYGWSYNPFGGFPIAREIRNGVVDPDNSFFSYLSPAPFGIAFQADGKVHLLFSLGATPGDWESGWVTFRSYTIPTDRRYHLKVVGIDLTPAVVVPPVLVEDSEGGGLPVVGPGGFSLPRDFAATINAATGQVQYTWSPPSVNPHLVTGYEMYEAGGSTVVMPADLVYNYQETLAPGDYTRKLRATDGTNYSAYVSVTFTVPEAPPTVLTLTDRDTGNTLVDRISGDILESR